MDKQATTSQPIHDLLAARWSPRSFDPDARISAEQMQALAEAARWSPSCFGAEPWGYVLCNKHDDPTGWDRAFACLAEGNQNWVRNASLLILAAARHNFERNDNPNRHHLYDTGAASMALVLQAEVLGLRAHQMGGFDPDKAQTDLAVPAGWTCIAMIAVGVQAAADRLEGQMQEMEIASRQRKELATNFFVGKWGETLA